MLMSWLIYLQPGQETCCLFFSPARLPWSQWHECLRGRVGDSLILAQVDSVWLGELLKPGPAFGCSRVAVARWSNTMGMHLICPPPGDIVLVFFVKRRKFFSFAQWLCPCGMKMSNAGSTPCTCWVPPSGITWATGGRWRQAGLEGSWGGVYGWSLEPPPGWEQVLKRSHNAGTCSVLPCRSGCWRQTLGTFILQHCPGVYSLLFSSSFSSLGRTERKQRAFSDNLHCSFSNLGLCLRVPCAPSHSKVRVCAEQPQLQWFWRHRIEWILQDQGSACWGLRGPWSSRVFPLPRGDSAWEYCPGPSQLVLSTLFPAPSSIAECRSVWRT